MRTPKSFEEGMERLNTLLAQMQSEDTTLADSVKLYAEAASLMEYCHAALEKTSLQIDEIDAKLAGHSAGGKLMDYQEQYQNYLAQAMAALENGLRPFSAGRIRGVPCGTLQPDGRRQTDPCSSCSQRLRYAGRQYAGGTAVCSCCRNAALLFAHSR